MLKSEPASATDQGWGSEEHRTVDELSSKMKDQNNGDILAIQGDSPRRSHVTSIAIKTKARD